MGDIKGFLKIKKQSSLYRPIEERIKDYKDVVHYRSFKQSKEQATRCMDCGTPFCHWGCPVGNYIFEWNDLVYTGQWKKAVELLTATNNFPEFTGRVCPATCEYACVLGINDNPITIRENELSIIEYAFLNGYIKPNPPKSRTKKTVAVVGSGPAGLACADILNKYGHSVTVFEKDDKPGGILRYGIPDFKLEKWVVDRRIKLLKKEGIKFVTKVNVGVDYKFLKIRKDFDAVCLTIGSRTPRDIKVEGRDLSGIYFAMDYLTKANKRLYEEIRHSENLIDIKGKNVLVIGGGDTGSDCVGVSSREGAKKITQIELLPKPPLERTVEYPWPVYPMILKTSSSHEEGCIREWGVLTKKFIGGNGKINKALCVRVDFKEKDKNGCLLMKEIPNSEFEIEADLVILAMGFIHPEKSPLIEGLEIDSRNNIATNENYMTNIANVYAAGDAHTGAKLIVWAIQEGRLAAEAINKKMNYDV